MVIVDLSRSLESIISYSNLLAQRMKTNDRNISDYTVIAHKKMDQAAWNVDCDFVAQLSSSTINSGVLFLRFSPEGENLLMKWLRNFIYHRKKGLIWVDDQVRYTLRSMI